MVLNARDDHPSKATPITGRATNTLPRTAMQAIAHFILIIGGKREVKTANGTYRCTV